MPGIDTVFKIVLELIQALNPSELEKLQKEISVKQKEIDQKRKEWKDDKNELINAFVDPMDIPAINRIFAKWSDLLQP